MHRWLPYSRHYSAIMLISQDFPTTLLNFYLNYKIIVFFVHSFFLNQTEWFCFGVVKVVIKRPQIFRKRFDHDIRVDRMRHEFFSIFTGFDRNRFDIFYDPAELNRKKH